jgi:hypothetical protein
MSKPKVNYYFAKNQGLIFVGGKSPNGDAFSEPTWYQHRIRQSQLTACRFSPIIDKKI